ncbi:Dot/Icm T4SS effector AnkG/AnkZ/LegA7 [Legionella clemsonensis]|uniref:Ankyrin repeats (3 copies) n=1 Tax=Legionella clemsonensis TaxID=1867846 RepID=A0A222P5R4_9GAMM|nr:Dot/Icm T4SS effector AnkG/AnkZ/LegA7 [Legionella clemsonensis]ASQ47179.1 Ankyrin repeats (3 copies) [Legionella clemsonensis]
MIYFVYFLLLVATIVATKRLIIPTDSIFKSFFSNQKQLKHRDILTLLEHFNYAPDEGVCFGFTLTWAQDAALGIEECFYERLNLIRKHKQSLGNKIELVNFKIKNKERINGHENQLLEIKSLFEAICLAQSPEDYDDIYAQRLNQTHIDAIFSLIRHKLAQNSEVKRFLLKTTAFNTKDEGVEYFNQLFKSLKINDNVPMVLSSENHSVGLKKRDGKWLFIDINELYTQSEDYPYLILSSEALVIQLSISFSDSRQLIFHTDFIAANPSHELKRRLQRLDDIYPVFRRQISYKNSRQVGFLAISAQNGEEKTVRQILQLHNGLNRLSMEQISQAVFYAIYYHHERVLKLLIKARGFAINKSCRGDGATPLGIACDYGYLDLVKILLACPGVQVDAKNKDGYTPLMLACLSPHTRHNAALFEELLQAGANPKLRNIAYDDALTMARNVANQAAMEVLSKHHSYRVSVKNTSATTAGYSLFQSQKETTLRKSPLQNNFMPYI